MMQTTLCLLLKDQKILLGYKKDKFGKGKWNGYGGKVEKGETILQAAVRETWEEIRVRCAEEDLELVAKLDFYFPDKTDWDQTMNIFLIRNWSGEPSESMEMIPKWFNILEIPYDQMWPADKHWLPRVLKGEKLVGEFYFDSTHEGFEKFDLKTI